MVVRLWSGERREDRRLRRDRERRRGRRGGGAGRRAGLREVLQRPADATGIHPLRLMLEYAGSQRAGLRAERDAPRLLAVVRSIDWVLLVGSRGARRRRPLGRRGRHEVRDPERSELLPQPPDPLRVRGRGRARGRGARRSGSLPPLLARDLHRHGRGDRLRPARRARGARLDALDQPRLLHLPAVGVREASLRPRPRRDAGRAPARPDHVGDDAAGRRDRPRAGAARLRPARPRHRARLPRGARPRCSSSPECRGGTSPCSAPSSCSSWSASSGPARQPASTCSRATSSSA